MFWVIVFRCLEMKWKWVIVSTSPPPNCLESTLQEATWLQLSNGSTPQRLNHVWKLNLDLACEMPMSKDCWITFVEIREPVPRSCRSCRLCFRAKCQDTLQCRASWWLVWTGSTWSNLETLRFETNTVPGWRDSECFFNFKFCNGFSRVWFDIWFSVDNSRPSRIEPKVRRSLVLTDISC